MVGNKISGLSFPSKSDKAASREYADKVGNDARECTDPSSKLLGRRFYDLPLAFLKDNANFVARTPISMASQPLSDLTEPTKTSDAVTKKYVDDLIADNVGNIGGGGSPFFKENGNYQATHAINMAFKKLLNLSTPSEPYEAATKEYLDKRPHIIAVHTHYCGSLHEGEYHFIFKGNESYKLDTGFLILQSGRIKKIRIKISNDDGKNTMGGSIIRGSIFTIMAIREVSNLLTYECISRHIGANAYTTNADLIVIRKIYRSRRMML